MKQKLALACTLVHEPPLLVLDEPTTGVDPVSRREFWKLLAEFLSQGLTIVLATPYLDEAERCGRVALLSDGRRARRSTSRARCRPRCPGRDLEVVAAPPRRALDVLRGRRSAPIACSCSATGCTCAWPRADGRGVWPPRSSRAASVAERARDRADARGRVHRAARRRGPSGA